MLIDFTNGCLSYWLPHTHESIAFKKNRDLLVLNLPPKVGKKVQKTSQ
jgi:hypothetical protein